MKNLPSFTQATTFWSRLRGLIGQTQFDPLLIPHCQAIHTFGMKVPLDLYWLDQKYQVCRIDQNVPPQTIRWCFGGCHVLEAPAGHNLNLQIGDKIIGQSNPSFYQNQSGQTLVEAAFTLPVIITLVFGFIQIGIAITELQKLTYTVNYAAQVGALTNNDLKITGAIEQFYSLEDVTVAIESLNATTHNIISSQNRRYEDILKVQATRPFSINVPFVTLTLINLQAEASARVLCNETNAPYTCQ